MPRSSCNPKPMKTNSLGIVRHVASVGIVVGNGLIVLVKVLRRLDGSVAQPGRAADKPATGLAEALISTRETRRSRTTEQWSTGFKSLRTRHHLRTSDVTCLAGGGWFGFLDEGWGGACSFLGTTCYFAMDARLSGLSVEVREHLNMGGLGSRTGHRKLGNRPSRTEFRLMRHRNEEEETWGGRSRLRLLLTENELAEVDHAVAESAAWSRSLVIAEALHVGLLNPRLTFTQSKRCRIVEIRVPKKLVNDLQALARARTLTQQSLLRQLLFHYLANPPWKLTDVTSAEVNTSSEEAVAP
jgi:hypothetical protein